MAVQQQQPSSVFTAGYTYRKRQRSPCTLDVPLSDPELEGERHSKRYLSEVGVITHHAMLPSHACDVHLHHTMVRAHPLPIAHACMPPRRSWPLA